MKAICPRVRTGRGLVFQSLRSWLIETTSLSPALCSYGDYNYWSLSHWDLGMDYICSLSFLSQRINREKRIVKRANIISQSCPSLSGYVEEINHERKRITRFTRSTHNHNHPVYAHYLCLSRYFKESVGTKGSKGTAKTKIMSWMIVVVCRLEQSIGNLYRLSIRLLWSSLYNREKRRSKLMDA